MDQLCNWCGADSSNASDFFEAGGGHTMCVDCVSVVEEIYHERADAGAMMGYSLDCYETISEKALSLEGDVYSVIQAAVRAAVSGANS